MHVCIVCNNVLTYFNCDVYLCALEVFELGQQSAAGSGQAKKAINGKLLSILSHVLSEKIQSALKREQGWTHLLRCCQCWAAQVCMRQNMN